MAPARHPPSARRARPEGRMAMLLAFHISLQNLSPKTKTQNSEGEGRKRHSRECEREHVAAIEVKRNVTATEQ
jgi:hypothetical protein